MIEPRLISAIGSPLDQNEGLHIDGLRRHLDEQSRAGIDGVLVAGTMGLMQLLADATYRNLAAQSSAYWRDKGEVLIGVGDASYARTLDRLRLVQEMPVDGVVVLAPYFVNFSQAELLQYYTALADASRKPLFLYDLPQRTRTSLELETVLTLADHPNIAGIKCSGDIDQTKLLIAALNGSKFRVIVAQPLLLDSLLRDGIPEHLDGVFCMAPQLTRNIAGAARRGDWATARRLGEVMSRFLTTLREYGVFPAMTAIMNSHGIPGNFAPRPFQPLSDPMKRKLLDDPAVIAAYSDDRTQLHAVS